MNDDRLGRVLDELYQTGLNQIFVSIVLEVVKKYQIEVGTVHLDSSSFSVQGEYETDYCASEEEQQLGTIKITYGYSRDHRPDLKQFLMDLICSADGDVPLWMRIGDWNESDRQQFAQLMKDFKSQLKWDSLRVLDSAFYSQENLQSSQSLCWLSRVPLTVKTIQNSKFLHYQFKIKDNQWVLPPLIEDHLRQRLWWVLPELINSKAFFMQDPHEKSTQQKMKV